MELRCLESSKKRRSTGIRLRMEFTICLKCLCLLTKVDLSLFPAEPGSRLTLFRTGYLLWTVGSWFIEFKLANDFHQLCFITKAVSTMCPRMLWNIMVCSGLSDEMAISDSFRIASRRGYNPFLSWVFFKTFPVVFVPYGTSFPWVAIVKYNVGLTYTSVVSKCLLHSTRKFIGDYMEDGGLEGRLDGGCNGPRAMVVYIKFGVCGLDLNHIISFVTLWYISMFWCLHFQSVRWKSVRT